jgi:hypothetical protein
MRFIAIEKDIEGREEKDFLPFLKDEAKHVWALHQQNIIREIYFRDDKNNAVLILECENIAAAKSVIDTLPLVKNKLIEFDIIPLKPYPGFERLFETQ